MTIDEHLVQQIFLVNDANFNKIALDIFRFQATNNKVYAEFLSNLGIQYEQIDKISNIPFLPIELFKTRDIIISGRSADKVFTSSGTTGSATSNHHVADLKIYENSFRKGFEYFYGAPEKYSILALLPSYLEREGSSLIYMVEHLIKDSQNEHSGFYLYDHDKLDTKLRLLDSLRQKTILIGVGFALLDFAEKYPMPLKNTIIMETGGMKGRRKELIREELHEILINAFQVPAIHSEYGMTELLSQAYSRGKGKFNSPPWMKVLIKDVNDPFTTEQTSRTGAINVIDLANIYSCSFIATEDLGRMSEDGTFEVLGRMDNSDIRGCNLMI